MDIVLGVSLAPSAVQMVLVEGEDAGGVTVDQDEFGVGADSDSALDRVVSAILGTLESAQEGGYRLTSTGVTVGDQLQAGLLRDALADRGVDNVTLVSEFLAAAALTQTVGAAIGYAQTALLFLEPDSATLAVVDSADGSIAEVRRVVLPADDALAATELAGFAARASELPSRPDGMFLVGSGVNLGLIKSELETASRIPVSVPEEPETALARGAALASAHPPLFESSTSALAWARDPGTGVIDPDLVMHAYAYVAGGSTDYDATADEQALAYSAVDDDADSGYLPLPDGDVPDSGGGPTSAGAGGRKPFLLAGSTLGGLFVVGVSALAVALAVSIRPTADDHPAPSQHIVVPAQQAPAPPPKVQVPAPPPPSPPPPSVLPAPAPHTVQPPAPAAQQIPEPAAPPPAPAAPPPAPEAPAPVAPAPEAPAPVAPAPVAPVPIPVPIVLPAPAPAPAPPAAPPVLPQLPAPDWPSILKPPNQSPPKQGPPKNDGLPGWPGIGGGRDGANPWHPGDGGDRGGLFPGFPGKGGDRGGLFPGFPGNGGGHNGGLLPWLGGGGHRGGLGGGHR